MVLKDRTRGTYTAFSAMTLVISIWYFTNFIEHISDNKFYAWVVLWPAATLPPMALRFFRSFLAEPSIGGNKKPPRVTVAWTLAFYLALLYSFFVQPIHEMSLFRIPLGVYVYGTLYRCVFDLFLEYRSTTSRVSRARILYLLLGGLITITLSLTSLFPYFGEPGPALGAVFTVLYLYFLSQTLFRYRLLDVNELVGKMAVLGTLVALLWGLYGLLLAWKGRGGDDLSIVNALIASFVILILFEPVRGRMENSVNRWIVRQRYELRGRIADVRRELKSSENIRDMVDKIVHAVQESRRLTHVCFYLIDAEGNGYDLQGFHGPQSPPQRIDNNLHKALLDKVRGGFADRGLLKRQLKKNPEEKNRAISNTLEFLESYDATVMVPIFGSAETEQGAWLLGVLGFHDDRIQGAFDLDDIESFRKLADECAKTIESAQFYSRVNERDRLAAIGEMAAGLAHEIRNPLGAIKGAAQLLVGPDGKPIPASEDSSEWLGIIVEEVDRLNNVVTQFLDYARPERSGPSEYIHVDINQVVQKTVQLLENSEHKIKIEVVLDELVPPVLGDPEQLRQVFLNLGLNAVQAMGESGQLTIITSRRRRSSLGYGSFSEVRFRDTGPGIPAEAQKSLFIPFFTTKQRGSGLGLAVSERIVTQHNGTIEFRSKQGQGSTFSVFIPALGPSLPGPTVDRSLTATQSFKL